MQLSAPSAVLTMVAALVAGAGLASLAAGPAASAERSAGAGPLPTDGFRLINAYAASTVTVTGRGTEKRCAWQPDTHRFQCGARDWQFVGPWAGRSNGEAVRCVWVHPPRDGKTLELRWPQVDLGDSLTAALYLMDGAGQREAVRATVHVDGRQVTRLQTRSPRHPVHATAAIPPGPAKGLLSLQIDARDSAWRLACADLLMTGTRTAP